MSWRRASLPFFPLSSALSVVKKPSADSTLENAAKPAPRPARPLRRVRRTTSHPSHSARREDAPSCFSHTFLHRFAFPLRPSRPLSPTRRLDFSPNCVASAFGGRDGGASSSMLRVTLREVCIAEDAVQSSLSPSGEISRVDAVLELGRSAPARPAFAANHSSMQSVRSVARNLVNPVNPVKKQFVKIRVNLWLTLKKETTTHFSPPPSPAPKSAAR